MVNTLRKAELFPADGLEIHMGAVEKQRGQSGVHRLRKGDLEGAVQRDRLLAVGQRRIVEARPRHLGCRLGMKCDSVVLLAEADALAGTRDLHPVAGVGLELGTELEGARVLYHHRIGHRWADLEAVLY